MGHREADWNILPAISLGRLHCIVPGRLRCIAWPGPDLRRGRVTLDSDNLCAGPRRSALHLQALSRSVRQATLLVVGPDLGIARAALTELATHEALPIMGHQAILIVGLPVLTPGLAVAFSDRQRVAGVEAEILAEAIGVLALGFCDDIVAFLLHFLQRIRVELRGGLVRAAGDAERRDQSIQLFHQHLPLLRMSV